MGIGIIALWSFIWVSSVLTFDKDSYVVVNTNSGDIRGEKKAVFGKVIYSFLGIPFAKPPIGRLRFRNPERIDKWENTLLATKFSKTCYQNLPEQHELNNPVWRVWINNTEMSEDCLYLNIWTPGQLPISSITSGFNFQGSTNDKIDEISTLVWIHGGGFTSGSSTLDIYNGEILASKMNVIVISIQYRLGPFGFLSFNDNNIPGNMGLMDQVMALQWINENIASFGGNVKYITLFGADSGAVSASFHLLSPLTQGLFNQAIMQSGSALSWWAYENPKTAVTKAHHFANLSGCHAPKEMILNKDFDLFECLRSLDPITLIVNQWKMLNERYRDRHRKSNVTASFYFDIPFKPMIESKYLPHSPYYYLMYNHSVILRKRVMLGINKNEGLIHLLKGFRMFFMPSEDGIIEPLQFKYGINLTDPLDLMAHFLIDEKFLHNLFIQAIAFEYQLPSRFFQHFDWKPQDIISVFDNIVGDYSFKCPVVDFADLYLKISKVYLYSFEHQTKFLPFPSWTGVLQGQEIAYIFGKPFDAEFSRKYYSFTKEEEQISLSMMTFWTNFAQTGHPNNRMKEYHTRTRDMYWEMYADTNFNMNNRKHIVFRNKTVLTERNLRRHECLFWRNYLPIMRNVLLQNTKCPPRTKYVQEAVVTVPNPSNPPRNNELINKPKAKSSKSDPENSYNKQSSNIHYEILFPTYIFWILHILCQSLS